MSRDEQIKKLAEGELREIRGAAETIQWGTDTIAAEWLLRLVAEIARLREKLGIAEGVLVEERTGHGKDLSQASGYCWGCHERKWPCSAARDIDAALAAIREKAGKE